MKIKETIERECCDPAKDFAEPLLHVANFQPRHLPCPDKIRVCKHCGQWWVWDSSTGPAGDVDSGWERFKLFEVVR